MCVFCAAIPVTAAVGAKLNAEQLHKPEESRKPCFQIYRCRDLVTACRLHHLSHIDLAKLGWPSAFEKTLFVVLLQFPIFGMNFTSNTFGHSFPVIRKTLCIRIVRNSV